MTTDTPFPIEPEQGSDYCCCSCGKSKNQPFCDGSHKGSKFSPKKFTAVETETAYLCGCKETSNSPFCDGSHNNVKLTVEEKTFPHWSNLTIEKLILPKKSQF